MKTFLRIHTHNLNALHIQLISNMLYISEAEKQEQINKASGEAQAMLAVAEARARGLKMIANALADRVSYFQCP